MILKVIVYLLIKIIYHRFSTLTGFLDIILHITLIVSFNPYTATCKAIRMYSSFLLISIRKLCKVLFDTTL